MRLSRFFLYISVLFLASQNLQASSEEEYEPLTSAMIEEGLTTWVDYTENKIKRLAAHPRSMFMLKQIHMQDHRDRRIPILVAHVLRNGIGYMHFFKWRSDTTDTENYETIDQTLYETGKIQEPKDNYLGSIHYVLGKLANDTWAETDEDGYFKAMLDRPIYYCYLSDLVVKSSKHDDTIGSALIAELAEFVFRTRSARFIFAHVPGASPRARCVYARNGFVRKHLSLNRGKVNFDEYLIQSDCNYMISLNEDIVHFVPIFDRESHYNKYLSRAHWRKRLKQQHPRTQDDSSQTPSRKDTPE